jgi:uncharacterized membrane protein YeaQ/YmgE (transglycosylase-associated protein family)
MWLEPLRAMRVVFPIYSRSAHMHILWIILIGFVAGVLAKLIHPGPNEPSGFVLTTLLGIAGAFLATYLGQAIGWYRPDQGAGLIGAVVGALIVLAIWGVFARRERAI